MSSTDVQQRAASQAIGHPTPDRIIELGQAFWGAKALLSAVELGLFSTLAAGPLDAEARRARLGLHPRGARDFCDALVALGLLEREGDRYRNTPATDLFLDRAKPSYVGGWLEMANARLYAAWGALTAGLRTGRPQGEVAAGGNFHAALYQDPARLRLFVQARTGRTMGTARALAQVFPWGNYRTIVDVGAAQGALLVQLALAHGYLSGGGFDLPPVGPLFAAYVTSFGLGHRLAFYPGDFARGSLPGADVLVMGHFLCDWSLEEKRLLIAKAYEALPKGGALLVYDALIDDERRHNALGLLMSLNLLLETPGGFSYSGAECCAWLREAGFRHTYVHPLVGPDAMVVGIK
jgi:hypothetical protein